MTIAASKSSSPRAPPRHQVGGAEARVLLVGDRGHEDVPGEAGSGVPEEPRRLDTGGERALHVVGAAPVQPAVLDPGRERILHALHAHRVVVRVEHEGGTAPRARKASDDAGAARLRFVAVHGEPRLAHVAGRHAGDRGFPRGSGHEGRVHRVRGNEVREHGREAMGVDGEGHDGIMFHGRIGTSPPGHLARRAG